MIQQSTNYLINQFLHLITQQFYSLQSYNMPNDKINQVLRDRKIKKRKVAHYRKQRIVKHYKQIQNQQQNVPEQLQGDQANQRKLDFYNKVFDGSTPTSKKKKNKPQEIQQVDESQQKLDKLKAKKKHLIKKMKQKTPKGQPLMRNYVKYALTKLQQSLQKERKQKKSQ